MQRPIDETDLKFDRAEITEAAQRIGLTLEDRTKRAILLATNGLPIAVTYALTRLRADPFQSVPWPVPSSFEDIATDIFGRRTEREKEVLMVAAMLPRIEDDVLGLLGFEDFEAIRNAMGSDTAFMWERDAQGGTNFHDRFRDYLARELQAREVTFRAKLAHHVIDSLVLAGRHAAALEVATLQPMIKAIGELLDTYGFGIIESGETDIISEALAAVEEASLGAVGVAVRAYMEARSGHLDTAEAWFRLAFGSGTG
jgi:ATP/maltotriose-dependent transcriptional regulator MalT